MMIMLKGEIMEFIGVENSKLTNENVEKTACTLAHTQIKMCGAACVRFFLIQLIFNLFGGPQNTHCCKPIRALEVMGTFDWLQYSSRHCPMV